MVDIPATSSRAENRPPEGARALDQARRPRVKKAPDERRREILEAATRLFREQGFGPTSVPSIARHAGMAAGTVYLYFPSKESILVALQDDFEAGLLDRFSEIAETVLAREDESGEIVGYEEVVELLVDEAVAYTLEHRAVAEVMARHVGRGAIVPDAPLVADDLTDLLSRIIREGMRLGYVQTSDPEMAAYLLTLAAVSAIANVVAYGDDAMLARVVAATKELYVKALAPDTRPV